MEPYSRLILNRMIGSLRQNPATSKCRSLSTTNVKNMVHFEPFNRGLLPKTSLASIPFFQLGKTSRESPLLPQAARNAKSMVWVNKNVFRSAPNYMCEVDDDVLAFFSLFLSYVEGNELRNLRESPKYVVEHS